MLKKLGVGLTKIIEQGGVRRNASLMHSHTPILGRIVSMQTPPPQPYMDQTKTKLRLQGSCMLQNEDVCEKKLILTEEFENLRFDCFLYLIITMYFTYLEGLMGCKNGLKGL